MKKFITKSYYDLNKTIKLKSLIKRLKKLNCFHFLKG